MKTRDLSIDIAERELTVIVSLNKHAVRYLIVGGYAMLFHGDEDRLVQRGQPLKKDIACQRRDALK